MSTLDSRILELFLTRVRESGQVNDALVGDLEKLLSNDKLPKPDDLAGLYIANGEENCP